MKRTLIACVAVAALIAGCADAPTPVDTPADPELAASPTRDVLPLPPDATLQDAEGLPAEPYVPQRLQWEGSLNPRGAEEDTPNVDRIRDRGRLVVGIDQSLYLLAYRDAAGVNRVDLRFVDSAARTDALNTGDVDVVIRTMSITPERADEVEFSTPYLTSRVRVLVPRDRGVADINQLEDKTVCIVDGTNLDQIARAFAPHSALLRTRSWSDCLMATQQFQADAVMADDAILAGLAAQDPYVSILPGTLATQYYGVAVGKGQGDLVRQVNATMERMRNDGTWSELYGTWLGGSIAASSLPPLMYRKEEQ